MKVYALDALDTLLAAFVCDCGLCATRIVVTVAPSTILPPLPIAGDVLDVRRSDFLPPARAAVFVEGRVRHADGCEAGHAGEWREWTRVSSTALVDLVDVPADLVAEIEAALGG